MATDWAADVKKYVANADDAAIAGIVRYLGIALRNRDSSLVSFSDKTETDRVRTNFLKKKLGLTQADTVLDQAIAKVGEAMKADRTKNRVTVYYLLAAEYKKLGLFVKADAKKAQVAKAPAAKAPAKPAATTAAKAAGAAAVVAGAAAAAKAGARPAAKAAAKPAAKPAAKTASAKPAAAKAAPAKAAAKLTSKKAPAKKQGLMGSAAKAAPKAEKPATGAVAGTIAAGAAVAGAAVAAASGAADAAKDTAAKAMGSVGDAAGAVAGAASHAADKVGVAAGAAVGAVGNAASAAADKASTLFAPGSKPSSSDSEDGGMGWLLWLLAAALLLFALWWMFGRGGNDDMATNAAPTEAAATLDGVAGGTPAAPAADLAAAPAEGTVAIPAGAGVTTEMRDGKPVVKVYFDTSKTEVVPAFVATATGLKSYLDSNPGSKLAISGYSDPSGNAAANAELSKNRAQAVQTALVDAGIAADAALLVKPENSADGSVSKEAARRVEVTVQ
ncbi:DUF2853 family protein [Novosphingobium sp.]|uniref:DUF2853 family protein n=1 Tax=Novosphingobium sp. TaxID=1874826 RepID=UPI00286BE876|nr:DUF2853 family protein [Novosphingobium sp.]